MHSYQNNPLQLNLWRFGASFRCGLIYFNWMLPRSAEGLGKKLSGYFFYFLSSSGKSLPPSEGLCHFSVTWTVFSCSVGAAGLQEELLWARMLQSWGRGWLFHRLQILEKWWRGNNCEELKGVCNVSLPNWSHPSPECVPVPGSLWLSRESALQAVSLPGNR